MSNLDETKVKVLLLNMTDKIMSCFELNQYNKSIRAEIRKMISETNLLQDQPACATVKHQLKRGN